MKTIVSISLLVFAGLVSTAVAEENKSDKKVEQNSNRQYTVDCHIAGKGKNISLTIPKMIVLDGEKKSVSDISRKSFDIGNKSQKANEIIRRELTEGLTIEATVIGNGDKEATLDLTFEASGRPKDGASKKGQIRWSTNRCQVFENVVFGEKIIAEFRDFNLEIEVNVFSESNT